MQKFLFLCLAFLTGFAFTAAQAQQTYLPVSSQSKAALKHYNQGMDAAFNADFAQMGEHLAQATAEDPNFFMAYFQQAMVNWWFQNQEGFDEQYAKAMASKGELNQSEQACKQLLMAVKANPAADVGSFGQKLVDAAPKAVEAHLWNGHLNGFTQNPKASLPAYEKAASLGPNVAGIQNALGYAYMADMQMDKAEKAFDQYIKLKPDAANPYDSKGDFLMAAGKYGEAEKLFRKAFQMNEGFTGSKNKAEVAAAMQVAAKETASFFKRDYEAWADCYKKGPAVCFAYTDQSGAWIYQGWQEASKAAKSMMAENPNPIDGEISRSNFNWRVREDNVWVTYDQKVGDNTTKEMRVLDKVDGEWKMLLMNAIGASSYEQPVNTLKSVSMFKSSASVDPTELSKSMDRVNAAIDAIGYPDAGYQLWVVKSEDDTDSQILIEGYWPDQETYDAIHDHERYKAATQAEEAVFKALERISYKRVTRIK